MNLRRSEINVLEDERVALRYGGGQDARSPVEAAIRGGVVAQQQLAVGGVVDVDDDRTRLLCPERLSDSDASDELHGRHFGKKEFFTPNGHASLLKGVAHAQEHFPHWLYPAHYPARLPDLGRLAVQADFAPRPINRCSFRILVSNLNYNGILL